MSTYLNRFLLPLVGSYCFVKAFAISFFHNEILPMLEISAQSAAGRIEFISVYAGFFLGLGIFLLWSQQRPERRHSAFLLLALASGGTLSYRLLLHLLWQTGGMASLAQLLGEVLLCGGSFWGWRAGVKD